jgi:hypothetical protein
VAPPRQTEAITAVAVVFKLTNTVEALAVAETDVAPRRVPEVLRPIR